MFEDLEQSVARVPPGKWAVGVSGGADSVALLTLLVRRRDLSLEVVHLDHELRGQQSRDDARFVRSLAAALGIACTEATRSEIERELPFRRGNLESRLRDCRLELFRRVVRARGLNGVILAHHLEDHAETILMRLARGGSLWTLRGIESDVQVDGLRIVRPLLNQTRARLREWLQWIGQSWREDSTNQSTGLARNRARRLLSADASMPAEVGGRNRPLMRSLVELGASASRLCAWIDRCAPILPDEFPARMLAELPDLLARRSAMRWLGRHGCEARELSAGVLDRLLSMARDAASGPRQGFPGGITVHRRSGIISAVKAPTPNAAGQSATAAPPACPDV